MDKIAIKNFASNNGFHANYSGKAKTWFFVNRTNGATTSRKVGKGLTSKMLSNTFAKAN